MAHSAFVIPRETEASWPALPLDAWSDTCATLHMWTQIAGKIRTAASPKQNHWWHSTLYVSARGLTTSPIPYGSEVFEIQFDFLNHRLDITTSNGGSESFALTAQPVAEFYQEIMGALHSLGVSVAINTKPQEVANPIPFEQDDVHRSYDPVYAHRFWRILLSTSEVLSEFRSRFIGKCSPVHFFWGSLDLACTRFSGRRAPQRKGAISGEAYSHEVCSAGFWPGQGFTGPAFYCYTVPKPDGLENCQVRPASARWEKQLGECILAYDDVRLADSPGQVLRQFLETTYEAGAKLAAWDRAALEAEYSAEVH